MPQPSPEAKARLEVLTTVAMLAGEGKPVYCALCMGKGQARGLMLWHRCPECGGVGFCCLGPAVKAYVEQEYAR